MEEFPPLPMSNRLTPKRTSAALTARVDAAPIAGPSAATHRAPVLPSDTEERTSVSRRKRKGRKTTWRAAPAATLATGQHPRAQAVPNTRKVELHRPKSTAVVVQLKPEAIASGMTYSQAIRRAKDVISLEELGIRSGLRSRTAQNGSRLLEVPGTNSAGSADLLAKRLEEVLADVAVITRPEKCADIRLSGLDDSVIISDLITAVAEQGGCSTERVKVGAIREGPGGSSSALVNCPIKAAKTLANAGRLSLKWGVARVAALKPRPMRCFRCMGVGHARQRCPSTIDRSDLCFRCGQPGHQMRVCSKEPRCVVCAEAKRPFGHVTGSRGCSPPATRAKPIGPNKATSRELTLALTPVSPMETVEPTPTHAHAPESVMVETTEPSQAREPETAMETVEAVEPELEPQPPALQQPLPSSDPGASHPNASPVGRRTGRRVLSAEDVAEMVERDRLESERELAEYEEDLAAGHVRPAWRKPYRTKDGRFAKQALPETEEDA